MTLSKAPSNFCGLQKDFSEYNKSKIVILPVPFDKTSTWIKGADKGPQAIIDASMNMELYDINTCSEVYKKGIFTEKPVDEKTSEKMIQSLEKKVACLLNDKKFIVVLGGEHSISIGAISSFSKYFKDLSVLHLDAHSDMRDEYLGSKYNHACVMARAKEFSNKIVSVGIRSMDSSELKNINQKNIFFAKDIHDSKEWMNDVVERLSDNVYITIDLDVFNPSIMPSTGTPEPGGLDWYSVTELLKKVVERKNVIGFDVVELCPNNKNKAPDFLAAKLIYTVLSYKFKNEEK